MLRARTLLAPVVGIVVGALVVAAVEAVGHLVFPPPPGLDLGDPEALAVVMKNAPMAALLFVLAAWFAGTTAAFVSAVRTHPRREAWPGYLAVGALALGAAASVILIPHPTWFLIAAVMVYVAALAVARQSLPRRPDLGAQ